MTIKFMGLEVSEVVPPLPYAPIPAVAGLVTVTGIVAAVAIADAGIVAVSWFVLTTEVVCAAPFQLMVAVFEKPEPLTVKTNAAAPCVMLSGAS